MSAEAVLAALYLRGLPRPLDPPRRGWPAVLAAYRRTGGEGLELELRRCGMELPATVLSAGGVLDAAERAIEDDSVLTAACEGYPVRWLEILGDAAPPALWRSGRPSPVRRIGAVGSRDIDDATRLVMAEVGRTVAELGLGIVSGGAMGCDATAERAALAAGGAVLRLLPHGLGHAEEDDAVRLSLAAPHEPFSRALAMERNALIYAAADTTIVGHVRLRRGGTWHGASDALRRRLGRLLVRSDDSAGCRALMALGAEPLESAEALPARLADPPPARSLFAYETRRGFDGLEG